MNMVYELKGAPDALWDLLLQRLKCMPTNQLSKELQALQLPERVSTVEFQLKNLQAKHMAASGNLPKAMWTRLVQGLKVCSAPCFCMLLHKSKPA